MHCIGEKMSTAWTLHCCSGGFLFRNMNRNGAGLTDNVEFTTCTVSEETSTVWAMNFVQRVDLFFSIRKVTFLRHKKNNNKEWETS